MSQEKIKKGYKTKNKSIIYSYSKEEMQAILDNSSSYVKVLEKIGINPRGGNPKTLKKFIKEFGLNEDKLNKNRQKLFSENGKKASQTFVLPLEQVLKKNVKIRGYKLLKRLEREKIKEHKCEICGITEWLGKSISLQLHHIDGDNTNQELNNLMVLCPNCHSQTDNYAGKSSKRKQKKKYFCIDCGKEITKGALRCKKCSSQKKIKSEELKNISREEFKKLIREKSFLELGRIFNMSDNGIKRWCGNFNLPTHKKEINSYSDEEWNKI